MAVVRILMSQDLTQLLAHFDEKIILNGVEVYRKLMEYKNMFL